MSADNDAAGAPERPKLFHTREQKLLVIGVKGLAEQTAHRTKKRWRLPQPLVELIRHAHWGIALAAQTYDAQRGFSFWDWAALQAVRTILDATRVAGKDAAWIQAAQEAALQFVESTPEERPEPIAEAYDEENRATLRGYRQRLLRRMLLDIAATPQSTGGEDEMIDRLDGIRVARILLEGFEALSAALQEVMRLLWEYDEEDPLAELTCERAAAKLGVTRFDVYRRRDEAIKLLRARLAAKRITELPYNIDEIWAAVITRRRAETRGR